VRKKTIRNNESQMQRTQNKPMLPGSWKIQRQARTAALNAKEIKKSTMDGLWKSIQVA
jgi:hypothetical protein